MKPELYDYVNNKIQEVVKGHGKHLRRAVYDIMVHNHTLEKVGAYDEYFRKHRGYWTLETCKKSALKYKTRYEWSKTESSAYNSAVKNDWLDECCGHMVEVKKPTGYWTLERCKESALKYNIRGEWQKHESSAYSTAYKNNWMDECCGHMVSPHKPMGYWTLEKCKESALKYNTRGDWRKVDSTAYSKSVKNNWLDECCEHMVDTIKPSGYWTLETCKESALNYSNRTEWQNSDYVAYTKARKNNWLDECCGHMKEVEKIDNWTSDRCKESALRYKTRGEWQKHESSAYNKARINSWLDECCGHMQVLSKPASYWILEKCKESALKYKTRTEWLKGESGAHKAALKNNWMDECCGHMVKRGDFWTLETCKESALKYNTRNEWSRGESGAHTKARKNKWMDECCGHMKIFIQKPQGYWTLERCKESALKYKTKREWHKGENGAYRRAKENNWLEECCVHMKTVVNNN